MSTETVQALPTFQELASGPSTPFWVKDLIAIIATKDCVDVANSLKLLATVADAECRKVFSQ